MLVLRSEATSQSSKGERTLMLTTIYLLAPTVVVILFIARLFIRDKNSLLYKWTSRLMYALMVGFAIVAIVLVTVIAITVSVGG